MLPPSCSCGASGSRDRKSTRLNSCHVRISYAVFCLKKKSGRHRVRRRARRAPAGGASGPAPALLRQLGDLLLSSLAARLIRARPPGSRPVLAARPLAPAAPLPGDRSRHNVWAVDDRAQRRLGRVGELDPRAPRGPALRRGPLLFPLSEVAPPGVYTLSLHHALPI